MKKMLSLMFLLMIILLVGCSSGNNTEGELSAPPAQETKAAAEATDQPAIEVDKNLLSVEITLPASMFEGQDIDEAIAKAKEDGVKEATKNEDGSVTYKMSKSDHEKMLTEMKDSFNQTIEELKSGETFTSIKDITNNKSYSEFTLIVDQQAYEGSFDAFATFGLGIQGMFYQVFDGIASEKVKVTINVQDESTGTVFDTIVYPQDIGNE